MASERYTARKQNPNATLGFIVNFKTDRAVDQLPYVNMATSICKDWGIEYLDLYNMEGFTVTFDDGLHPDSAGYDSTISVRLHLHTDMFSVRLLQREAQRIST